MKKTIAFQILVILILVAGALYEGYYYNLSWIIDSPISLLILFAIFSGLIIVLFKMKPTILQTILFIALNLSIYHLTFGGYRDLFHVGKEMWINNTMSKTEWIATYNNLDSILEKYEINQIDNSYRYNNIQKRIECNNSITCSQSEKLNKEFHKEIKEFDKIHFHSIYRDSSRIIFEASYRDFGCRGLILNKDGAHYYHSAHSQSRNRHE